MIKDDIVTPIFGNSLCSLERIPAPVYPFIDDCQLIRTPEPIYECPGLDIPIDIPLSLDTFCPDLFASATVGATQTVSADLSAEVHVTTTRSPSSVSCGTGLDFDFQFNFPLPKFPDSFCPRLAVAATTESAIGQVPAAHVTATRNVGSTSKCRFDFDFDFKFPLPKKPICPGFSATAHTTVGLPATNPAAHVTATRHSVGSHCGFVFDFNFNLPQAPKPICPAVKGSATLEFTYGSHTAAHVVATRHSLPGVCFNQFDFDFVLPHPPCPNIGAVATTTMTIAALPQVNVVITRVPVGTVFSSVTADGHHVTDVVQIGECDYIIDFDFALPAALFDAGNKKESSRVIADDHDSGSGGGAACGCCKCYVCLVAAQRLVGGCDGCPNEAGTQYSLATGIWAAYPSLTPGGAVLFNYRSAICSSSSSYSSSAGASCTWYSCPVKLCQPSSSSSGSGSSGSSSDGLCGTYQFVLTVAVAGGQPQSTVSLVLVSGTDILNVGTGLIMYQSREGFDCLCESPVFAMNAADVPKPTGLNCSPCLTPLGPTLKCCCNCWTLQWPGMGSSGSSSSGGCSFLNGENSPQSISMLLSSTQCTDGLGSPRVCSWLSATKTGAFGNPYHPATLQYQNSALTTQMSLEVTVHTSGGDAAADYITSGPITCGTQTFVLTGSPILPCGIAWPPTLTVVAAPCS